MAEADKKIAAVVEAVLLGSFHCFLESEVECFLFRGDVANVVWVVDVQIRGEELPCLEMKRSCDLI
jgi:hypothetical protein